MWIQVRTMDGKTTERVDGLSKLTKVEDLRKDLVNKFQAPVHLQRLFYRGKQLEDGHTLYDYDVGLNDIIQILIKPELDETVKKSYAPQTSSKAVETKVDKENLQSVKNNSVCVKSQYFVIEDIIDVKDDEYGAWFEAKVVNILSETPVMDDISNDKAMNTSKEATAADIKPQESMLYEVVFDKYEDDGHQKLPLSRIRPRARKILKVANIKVGDEIMVNYNVEEPKELGYWYDCKITEIPKKLNYLIGTIVMGPENVKLENCKITSLEDLFQIEKNVPRGERPKGQRSMNATTARDTKPRCEHCKDVSSRKCKYCSCKVCGGKNEPGKQILCDECDEAFHIWCLNPPLTKIPEEDEWYCPECKNDVNEVVKAGEKLKKSKKKASMPSAKNSTKRDWGKGMACVGRTKTCTIVPSNHFGPIPGVEVGTMWKFRMQVGESGIHRSLVGGIHGRENLGAFSIVLSGGYEDDLDEGEKFTYTGSGGRDLSGNKRTAEQSCDQQLTRFNKALAMNCAAKLDAKNGAEATNWKDGKPCRVVRNYKGHKHSKYCPEEGNRYDGIYKIVKYWPEKGKSGFLVWRYLLRRDDPTPAPWTKKGKERMKMLGLKMQYPDGYLEMLAEKEKQKEDNKPQRKSSTRRPDSDDDADSSEEEINTRSSKKAKILWQLPEDVQALISQDIQNQKGWNECLKFTAEGQAKFLKEVETFFLCICCQEVVFQPVSTECLHNICKSCLKRSFKAEVFSCPACRFELGKTFSVKINPTLQDVLLKLFPGYEADRV